MKKTDVIAASAGALFWVAMGLLACYGAMQLGLGTVTEPGPGFIFFWSGLVLMILAFLVLAGSIYPSGEPARYVGETNWLKIALVLLSLLLYAFFLERLGFMLTTFVLLAFLLGCIEDTRWLRSLTLAAAAALVSYAMFELWLKIRLPKGPFGF